MAFHVVLCIPAQVVGGLLLSFLSGLMMPATGLCGVIRTDITVTTRSHVEGGWDITALVTNTGDAQAYGLRAFVFVGDRVEAFTDLGDNPAGGSILVKARHIPKSAFPGRYAGMVRVHFEEMSGRRHRVFHPFSLDRGEAPSPAEALGVEVRTAAFHPKAFWRHAPKIDVRLRNPQARPATAHVQVFLPEGISTPSPSKIQAVEAGSEASTVFPLNLVRPAPGNMPFHVIVWQEGSRGHFSRHVEGCMEVEGGPFLIKIYGLSASAVLGLLFILFSLRDRAKRREGTGCVGGRIP